jgi:exodeoxyribonuclease-3
MSIKLASWNVNGLRACARSGFGDWLAREAADVVCVQEIKAREEDLPEEILHPAGYHSFWHSAKKPGYSGVAIYSRKEPISVTYGLGERSIDDEGRVLLAEFKNFSIISSYFPNSQRDHARLPYKLKFCTKFLSFCERQKQTGKSLLICGDFNIAHQEIDLRNPKPNVKNAGFLPDERSWMTAFLKKGYVDGFRHFNQDPGHYTWWSYRPGVRSRNIGWRIDYFMSDENSRTRLQRAYHQPEVMGSDHCPVVLNIKK